MRQYNRSRRGDVFTQNFLWIGYHAWQGYLNNDRGLVVISSDRDLLDDSDRYWDDLHEPSLNFRYIPQPRLSLYLEEWLVTASGVESILPAVASYRPDLELVFAIESGVNLDIGWCQRLKITPPDCYQQIWRRRHEFEIAAND
jgi:hypothetical protein